MPATSAGMTAELDARACTNKNGQAVGLSVDHDQQYNDVLRGDQRASSVSLIATAMRRPWLTMPSR